MLIIHVMSYGSDEILYNEMELRKISDFLIDFYIFLNYLVRSQQYCMEN